MRARANDTCRVATLIRKTWTARCDSSSHGRPDPAGMAGLALVIIAAYLVGMVAVGFWTQRKATNQEQFLVAGRSVGPLLYSGTLAAIIIGGGATIGGVKLGYTYGISGMWLVSMYGLGMIVMGVVLVPRILKLRRSEEHTSELQSQSNLGCRLLLGIKNSFECIREN